MNLSTDTNENSFELVHLEILERQGPMTRSTTFGLNNTLSVSSYLEQLEGPLLRARILAVFPKPLEPPARVLIVLVSSSFSDSLFDQGAKTLILNGTRQEELVADFSSQVKEIFGGRVELRVINIRQPHNI